MYNSLKAWACIPVIIKPFVKRTGTGSKIYGEPICTTCYADGKVKVVTDNTGTEVVSNKQLYIDGSIQITEMDCVVFEGAERSIKSLSTFYDKGRPSIRVVFI